MSFIHRRIRQHLPLVAGESGVSGGPEAQNPCLVDGRVVGLNAIHVEKRLSAARIVYCNSTARALHELARMPTTTIPGRGEMPTFVVPPFSVRRDAIGSAAGLVG